MACITRSLEQQSKAMQLQAERVSTCNDPELYSECAMSAAGNAREPCRRTKDPVTRPVSELRFRRTLVYAPLGSTLSRFATEYACTAHTAAHRSTSAELSTLMVSPFEWWNPEQGKHTQSEQSEDAAGCQQVTGGVGPAAQVPPFPPLAPTHRSIARCH